MSGSSPAGAVPQTIARTSSVWVLKSTFGSVWVIRPSSSITYVMRAAKSESAAP
jgi:hypothetical protein